MVRRTSKLRDKGINEYVFSEKKQMSPICLFLIEIPYEQYYHINTRRI